MSKEAYAYTPGLKVKRATAVAKLRRLPIPGEVLIKVGDEVKHNQVIARAEMKGDPEILKVAQLLGVEPEQLGIHMTKKAGEKVTKNEVVAAYRAMFGMINKIVNSPIDGTVESISETTGQVIIRKAPVQVEVDAYIPGKVTQVIPREGGVIETNAAFVQGIFGLGGERHGKIRIAVSSPREELTADHIFTEHKGTVLVGGSLVSFETLRKAAEAGVSCIVAGGIRPPDLKAFMREEIGVAITGQEDVELTLIITEGFGSMTMSEQTFNLLKDFENHMASINGATQIRAGVLRPEIIIPHEEPLEQKQNELSAGIVPGTAVRIIRQPYFGAIGKVVALPVELQRVKSESYVRVLQVNLGEGRVVTVPRANVEIIEG